MPVKYDKIRRKGIMRFSIGIFYISQVLEPIADVLTSEYDYS